MTSTTKLQTALNSEMDKLVGCIHCGLCLPSCPTYQQVGNENDSPRGRIYLMRAVAEGRLDADSKSFSRHIDLCLGCRACETACPAGVRYGFLLESARETLLKQRKIGRGGLQKMMLRIALRRIFPYPQRLEKVFEFSRRLRSNRLVKFILEKGIARKISSKADFALSLLMTTNPAGSPATGSEKIMLSDPRNGRPAVVFTGCVMEGLFKHANEATKRVLTINGCALAGVLGQVCCGALHAHAGDLNTARKLARKNIDAFERFLRQSRNTQHPPAIIINAAGCGALLKEYGELLQDDPHYAERARTFSEHVKDVTEFLTQAPVASGAELNLRVTLDAPCHLYHAQRVMTAPQKLLASIKGLEYVQLEGMQDCCGGAGIYNLSEAEMSESLLSDKIDKVKATGAEVLVTANPGCHMQLGAGVRMFKAECRVAHIVELLDESYRRAGFYQKSS
ncbi:MAG: 4Fe-4S dicluster domain-containing protein [Acidobacteria bacterium]|nr:4Fe-4S dicluster domain-containing protein [Acidobacteriota bacterium]